ncbi:hypothetical protein WOLCODRAFT_140730 [Wolfiporia cocos MD-104 SS10]|uniref:Uncharacterized protein n=1 Tax=Wolfiporia cocos (strain MD-104) TaxID=742152 RepID=A0A2H3J4G1_WOLCO|nr:hypothetical protein WOLCODRAFT_140730 [Wolfiporia cocos MD-104 SS10]
MIPRVTSGLGTVQRDVVSSRLRPAAAHDHCARASDGHGNELGETTPGAAIYDRRRRYVCCESWKREGRTRQDTRRRVTIAETLFNLPTTANHSNPTVDMRGTVEPAYPSFAFVLSYTDNDTRRSSSCRESHRRRYHPYSSKPRRQPPSTPMVNQNTADYRYEDALRIATSLLAYTPNAVAGRNAQNPQNLDRAHHPAGHPIDKPKRRHRLSDLIVDLALAARRRLARTGALQKLAFPVWFDLTS